MKTSPVRFLHHISAFLADRTKGFSLFFKWKIALGSILLGATVVSYGQKKDVEEFSDSIGVKKKPDITQTTTCYTPIISSTDTTTTRKKTKRENLQEDSVHTEVIQLSSCYVITEESASFPGGKSRLNHYFSRHTRPIIDSTVTKVKEDTIIATCSIDTVGCVFDIKILKGINEVCNAEAVRVLEAMPQWEPALFGNKAVIDKRYKHLIIPIRRFPSSTIVTYTDNGTIHEYINQYPSHTTINTFDNTGKVIISITSIKKMNWVTKTVHKTKKLFQKKSNTQK